MGLAAAAGVGALFLALHYHGRLTGCVQPGDDGLRLLDEKNAELGKRALRVLSNALFDLKVVVNAEKVKRLQQVPVWLDLTHGKLTAMPARTGMRLPSALERAEGTCEPTAVQAWRRGHTKD